MNWFVKFAQAPPAPAPPAPGSGDFLLSKEDQARMQLQAYKDHLTNLEAEKTAAETAGDTARAAELENHIVKTKAIIHGLDVKIQMIPANDAEQQNPTQHYDPQDRAWGNTMTAVNEVIDKGFGANPFEIALKNHQRNRKTDEKAKRQLSRRTKIK